ncbi:MAG: glycosyltransferase [Chitinivibrionales bacterium]|nr:glycosyltransferase [Chitinivibrionales bacterium]
MLKEKFNEGSFNPWVKKVLMSADAMGGVWTYVLELSRGLRDYGVEVIVATMGRRLSPQQRAVARKVTNLHVEEKSFKLEWMQEPWEDVRRAGMWLLELESMHSPDIVHLNGYAHGFLPFSAPVIVVAHSCVYSWFSAVKGDRPPKIWRRYYRNVKRGLNAAGYLVAPSRAMLQEVQRYYGPLSHNRYSVLYNGYSLPGKIESTQKEEIFVSAGRVWDEAKNMAFLDCISSKLKWPLYIAGDSIAPNGVSVTLGKSMYMGGISHGSVLDLLNRASVYVSAAFYEPFGLSALEAATCGCALVLPDIPSSREIWNNNALYASPNDPEKYCEILNMVAEKPGLRKEMARRAQVHAAGFSSSKMASDYMQLYSTMIANSDKFETFRDYGRGSEIKMGRLIA